METQFGHAFGRRAAWLAALGYLLMPTARAAAPAAVFGDADGDGRVTRADAVTAMRVVAGLAAPDAGARADVSPWAGDAQRRHGDGRLDLADVSTLLALSGETPGIRFAAESAVHDLLSHFWLGGPPDGHILPTRDGYATRRPPEGMLWERAQLLSVLNDLHRATGDDATLARMAAEWTFLKQAAGMERLSSVGEGSANGWSDDAGWSALMYLAFYRALGADDALSCAGAIFRNACDRWEDTAAGGLWYRDNHREKAVYQASLILAGIRLYEITGDREYWDRALPLYNWVEANLMRPDGLYTVEATGRGQSVNDHAPEQGSSDTFLGGNMAMGVIHARLFRDTGDEMYRQRAFRVANAILKVETQPDGIYLNDRDAWTEGFFMGDWAAEVLTLPGIGPEHAQVLRQSGLAVTVNSRTPDGYYSPCWSGPAEGEGCTWYQSPANVRPKELTTSANTVHVAVAAAGIGILQPAAARRGP